MKNERTALIQLGVPTINYDDDRLIFEWPEYHLQCTVERLTDEGRCEQSVYQGEPAHRQLIHISEVNLLSGRSRGDYSKALTERSSTSIGSPSRRSLLMKR